MIIFVEVVISNRVQCSVKLLPYSFICSFSFSAQIILHQWVSTFVFVALNL